MERIDHKLTLLALGGAVGLAAGLWAGRSPTGSVLPPLSVEAFAAHANEDFAVATGFVEDDVEALFCLDFITGELRGAVVDGRRGKFSGYYSHNVSSDLNLGAINQPRFLLIAGAARDLQASGSGGARLGRTVVYVVETTSGQAVAYGVPWNPPRRSAGKAQMGPFVPLDRAVFRTPVVNPDQPQ